MKVKSIIKQYCSNNVKLIFSMILFSFLTIIFVIATPVLIKYLINGISNIIVSREKITLLQSLSDYASNTEAQALVNDLEVLREKNTVLMVVLTIVLGITFVSSLLFNSFRRKKIRLFGDDIAKELRINSYSSLMKSELPEVSKFDKEDLLKNIVDDCYYIGNDYYCDHVIKLIYNFIFFIASLILLFVFNPKIGVGCLIATPVIYFVINSFNKLTMKKEKQYQNTLDKQNDKLDYSITNLKNIKVRNGVYKEEEKYAEDLEAIHKDYNATKTYQNLTKEIIFEFVLDCAVVVFMSVCAYKLCYTNDVSIGSIVGVCVSIMVLFKALKNTILIYLKKSNVDKVINEVNKVLDIKPESRSETINSLDDIYNLKFNSVSYIPESDDLIAIKDITFEVKRGEKLGILGLPGSGKTTIADLTAKIVRPSSGSVQINNCDITKLNTYYLRDVITYIPQEFNLFDGTIEQNITYPMNLDEYKYNEALNKCKLKEMLLNYPKRDQELIGDIEISSQDRQRIALANALYKDSSVIILDEATSKLDSSSENEIMNEFYKLKNKILITTSTRTSILAKCDKILILNEGKVLEYGKTEDLLKDRKSTFYRMINDLTIRRA